MPMYGTRAPAHAAMAVSSKLLGQSVTLLRAAPLPDPLKRIRPTFSRVAPWLTLDRASVVTLDTMTPIRYRVVEKSSVTGAAPDPAAPVVTSPTGRAADVHASDALSWGTREALMWALDGTG